MEKVNEISRRWHETNDEIRRVEDIIRKLEDISTFGGYKITFEKSTRGTAAPAKVELEAKFPGDLSLAVEAMREAQKSYFKTRNGDDLKRSKELERKVDDMIAYVRRPKLFD